MTSALLRILGEAWQEVAEQIVFLLPNLLAMLLILGAGWIIARVIQWVLERMSARVQKFLLQWGVPEHYGGASAAHLLARGAFWIVFVCAILMGVNVLNTQIGSLLATSALLYLPHLLSAGVIVLIGLLLGRFLARGALIWAVNEGIGPARLIAGGVRVGVGLLTFVVAAEQLDVGRTAVLATFIIVLSGAVLALALALGLGSRKRVEQWLDRRAAFLAEMKGVEERIKHL